MGKLGVAKEREKSNKLGEGFLLKPQGQSRMWICLCKYASTVKILEYVS